MLVINKIKLEIIIKEESGENNGILTSIFLHIYLFKLNRFSLFSE